MPLAEFKPKKPLPEFQPRRPLKDFQPLSTVSREAQGPSEAGAAEGLGSAMETTKAVVTAPFRALNRALMTPAAAGLGVAKASLEAGAATDEEYAKVYKEAESRAEEEAQKFRHMGFSEEKARRWGMDKALEDIAKERQGQGAIEAVKNLWKTGKTPDLAEVNSPFVSEHPTLLAAADTAAMFSPVPFLDTLIGRGVSKVAGVAKAGAKKAAEELGNLLAKKAKPVENITENVITKGMAEKVAETAPVDMEAWKQGAGQLDLEEVRRLIAEQIGKKERSVAIEKARAMEAPPKIVESDVNKAIASHVKVPGEKVAGEMLKNRAYYDRVQKRLITSGEEAKARIGGYVKLPEEKAPLYDLETLLKRQAELTGGTPTGDLFTPEELGGTLDKATGEIVPNAPAPAQVADKVAEIAGEAQPGLVKRTAEWIKGGAKLPAGTPGGAYQRTEDVLTAFFDANAKPGMKPIYEPFLKDLREGREFEKTVLAPALERSQRTKPFSKERYQVLDVIEGRLKPAEVDPEIAKDAEAIRSALEWVKNAEILKGVATPEQFAKFEAGGYSPWRNVLPELENMKQYRKIRNIYFSGKTPEKKTKLMMEQAQEIQKLYGNPASTPEETLKFITDNIEHYARKPDLESVIATGEGQFMLKEPSAHDPFMKLREGAIPTVRDPFLDLQARVSAAKANIYTQPTLDKATRVLSIDGEIKKLTDKIG